LKFGDYVSNSRTSKEYTAFYVWGYEKLRYAGELSFSAGTFGLEIKVTSWDWRLSKGLNEFKLSDSINRCG